MTCVCISWKQIEDYIDQQFEQYFRDESGLNRRNIQDNRVHCCLYFISPYGHGYADVFYFFTLDPFGLFLKVCVSSHQPSASGCGVYEGLA